ncbi:MAG TPA: aminotransferase class III-fold pyridoxal phosphate-dependent enzyme [Nocardioides sp.]|nr:aminotransferase class III-fold pyridoxal phosphate-dependent enzyme [Nocardioides sp.]
MTATEIATELSTRLDSLIKDETRTFLDRQRRSEAMSRRASVLAGGATSSWQVAEPHAVWLSHGNGSKLYDVDGNEYSDFHGGYGVSLAGHNHPAIVEAVRSRVALGTHFAQPTEDSIVVAENLAQRYHQPLWRFGNSGTESTMDAVHLMRAFTGRERILKLEGGYHGHHDSVMVSVQPESVDDLGPVDAPIGVPENTGLLRGTIDGTVIVPANNLPAVEAALERHPGEIAGMILEPIMMNAGIIYPDDGYLESLKDLLHSHGALLTFDEVKTGFTVGPGGASGLLGVTSDLVCVAKAMGGGLSTSAIGGGRVMELVATGEYQQVGTFNGNPLAMAAARAMLTEVLTDEAYGHLERLRDRMRTGLQTVIERHGAPWTVVTAGAKGCVSFMPDRIRNFRDFRSLDGRYGHAHWLVQHNRGAFLPPWGKVEQWLMSVQHTDEDVDRFVENFSHLADSLHAAA